MKIMKTWRKSTITMKTGILICVVMAAFTTGSLAQEKSSDGPQALRDGVGAKTMRFDNMHQVRFIELFLACKDPKTGKMVAPCYNTMFTSKGSPESKNTAPQKQVEGLDLEKIAKEQGVLKVSLNGPKIWLPDWIEVAVGNEIEYNGIKLGWCAQLDLPEKGGIEGSPYEPMKIARTSKWGWNKGTKTMLLDDPEGNTWILKGYQLGLHSKQTYDEFLASGKSNFKKLPKGWKVRIITLTKDVIEIPETGVATIMTDEMFNVWDKCGPGMTNYIP
jgi:hypothetical protein